MQGWYAMRVLWLLVTCAAIVMQCGAQTLDRSKVSVRVETTVHPLQNEDIASDCHYELTIPEAHGQIRGVWVIFDRGRDVHDLYSDADVVAFARRFKLALLLHGYCAGKFPGDHGDMNMKPSQGLGPALLRALDQFAGMTGHTELSNANLIFLGFSGAGPLSARLIAMYPRRVIAGILSSPGHFRPDGIDTVKLTREAQQVPELIIAGGADDVSGTQLPYEYFKKYRQLGSPWTFTVQNLSPHCCTANAKSLIMTWLQAVISRRSPVIAQGSLRRVQEKDNWLGWITSERTNIRDSFGLETFNVKTAGIELARSATTHDVTASWLPTASFAQEWLSFTRQDRHPILPLR